MDGMSIINKMCWLLKHKHCCIHFLKLVSRVRDWLAWLGSCWCCLRVGGSTSYKPDRIRKKLWMERAERSRVWSSDPFFFWQTNREGEMGRWHRVSRSQRKSGCRSKHRVHGSMHKTRPFRRPRPGASGVAETEEGAQSVGPSWALQVGKLKC
jgi:hypothetical protein